MAVGTVKKGSKKTAKKGSKKTAKNGSNKTAGNGKTSMETQRGSKTMQKASINNPAMLREGSTNSSIGLRPDSKLDAPLIRAAREEARNRGITFSEFVRSLLQAELIACGSATKTIAEGDPYNAHRSEEAREAAALYAYSE